MGGLVSSLRKEDASLKTLTRNLPLQYDEENDSLLIPLLAVDMKKHAQSFRRALEGFVTPIAVQSIEFILDGASWDMFARRYHVTFDRNARLGNFLPDLLAALRLLKCGYATISSRWGIQQYGNDQNFFNLMESIACLPTRCLFVDMTETTPAVLQGLLEGLRRRVGDRLGGIFIPFPFLTSVVDVYLGNNFGGYLGISYRQPGFFQSNHRVTREDVDLLCNIIATGRLSGFSFSSIQESDNALHIYPAITSALQANASLQEVAVWSNLHHNIISDRANIDALLEATKQHPTIRNLKTGFLDRSQILGILRGISSSTLSSLHFTTDRGNFDEIAHSNLSIDLFPSLQTNTALVDLSIREYLEPHELRRIQILQAMQDILQRNRYLKKMKEIRGRPVSRNAVETFLLGLGRHQSQVVKLTPIYALLRQHPALLVPQTIHLSGKRKQSAKTVSSAKQFRSFA